MVWAAVAASGLFWGLKLGARPQAAPAQTQLAGLEAPMRGDLSRLLGNDPAPVVMAAAPAPAPDARFSLRGVVSPRGTAGPASGGVALIAVDGKPARAYRVGAVVDGQHVLQTVSARGATLGPRGGAPAIALNIPPPPAAATGSLPSALGGQAAVAVAPGAAGGAVQANPVSQPMPTVPPQPLVLPPNVQTLPPNVMPPEAAAAGQPVQPPQGHTRPISPESAALR